MTNEMVVDLFSYCKRFQGICQPCNETTTEVEDLAQKELAFAIASNHDYYDETDMCSWCGVPTGSTVSGKIFFPCSSQECVREFCDECIFKAHNGGTKAIAIVETLEEEGENVAWIGPCCKPNDFHGLKELQSASAKVGASLDSTVTCITPLEKRRGERQYQHARKRTKIMNTSNDNELFREDSSTDTEDENYDDGKDSEIERKEQNGDTNNNELNNSIPIIPDGNQFRNRLSSLRDETLVKVKRSFDIIIEEAVNKFSDELENNPKKDKT